MTKPRDGDYQSLRDAVDNHGITHPITASRLEALGWLTRTHGGGGCPCSYSMTDAGRAALGAAALHSTEAKAASGPEGRTTPHE